MTFRPARESDFLHLETFVWQAIFPAFDLPELSVAQKSENDALVETARQEVLTALDERDSAVFVAIDPKSRTLAGYIIADASPSAYAEVRVLLVKRSFWGKGIAAKLLGEATNFIGKDRAVSLAVRNFNERAKVFFKKHGFVDTGETTGAYAIPRILMLREAFETLETPIMEDEKKPGYADDFPSSANEPVFEALPDYRLATDELPLFAPGENKLSTTAPEDRLFEETTLDEKTLTELEAFIARARALKGTSAPADSFSPVSPQPKTSLAKDTVRRLTDKAKPVSDPKEKSPSPATVSPRDIPFEVDFGDGRVEKDGAVLKNTVNNPSLTKDNAAADRKEKPSFEFIFTPPSERTDSSGNSPSPADGVTETVQDNSSLAGRTQWSGEESTTTKLNARKTKDCPDCETELPLAARFCFSCGYPQPEEEEKTLVGAKAPDEDFLVLEELPSEVSVGSMGTEEIDAKSNPIIEKPGPGSKPGGNNNAGAGSANSTPRKASGAISTRKYTMAELKQSFREHFQERVIAYFGEPKLKKYYAALEDSNTFQQLRDGSLTNLLSWINGGERTYAGVARRINDTMADLTEYFIVEVAGEISGNVLPQRLLRHQSVNWETVNLFKLVMDFLDFPSESERVYTDFVAMPARALRNATNSFLRAGKDERIFFICDQSLISQAKNGFALTDAGVYWKNVLQPSGSALFFTMQNVSISQGHLDIDGQFFNAGARLNLKMAVLLDKLRRMG